MGTPMNHNTVPLVPLSLIATELDTTAGALAAHFGGIVVHDDAGLRCVTAEQSRRYLAEIRAAQQAARDQAAAELAAARAQPNPVRERVRALQRAQRDVSVPAGPIAPGQALAMMQELDGSRERRLAAAAEQRDELTGRRPAVFHRIRPED